jgi:cathepsin X
MILSSLVSIAVAARIPEEWDWRNVSGVNYLTANLNQHIPDYCGSCWLHAGIAVLNDRLKIARNAGWPEISLARQVVLNCGAKDAGTCKGGSDVGVFLFAYKYGIPDDTCQPYDAKEHFCSVFRNCMNCDPNSTCYPVQRYGRYFVTHYGRVGRNVAAMQSEIFNYGPISCSVDAEELEYGRYQAGDVIAVAQKKKANADVSWEPDHDVEVVGWGRDAGGSHWIVRNSWGGYWGDQGIFKVRIGINSLGIEDLCHWARINPYPVIDDWGPDDSSRIFASAEDPVRDKHLWKHVVPKIYRRTSLLGDFPLV